MFVCCCAYVVYIFKRLIMEWLSIWSNECCSSNPPADGSWLHLECRNHTFFANNRGVFSLSNCLWFIIVKLFFRLYTVPYTCHDWCNAFIYWLRDQDCPIAQIISLLLMYVNYCLLNKVAFSKFYTIIKIIILRNWLC